ncbi:MAG TPA: branched-chain amino acid transaminase [Candidatus Bilamarchaeum sp.]|nr:branched-chain amino acid transaminase [Candidatus Bilamarchaeum sp.]
MPIKPLKKIFLNGKFVDWNDAKVHVLTHGLHYGTAIFEGMRCYDTKNGPAIFRMKDHYRRLIDGTKSYQFDFDYKLEKLCSITKELIRKNGVKSCYIRPICFAGYGTIGINPVGIKYEFAVIPVDFGKYFGRKAESGISCEVSSWKRISATILSPHVKASANYMNSVLAKREAVNGGYDEAIMLSDEGHVSEGTGENIFIVEKGELVTPPLYDGVLAGVTRETIIQLAKEMSIPVRERSVLRDELYTAEEVFLCGTAAEITPVVSIDKRKISNGPGPITRELKDTFFNVVNGKDERFIKWLDFVRG